MAYSNNIKHLQDYGDELAGICISLQNPACPQDTSIVEYIRKTGNRNELFGIQYEDDDESADDDITHCITEFQQFYRELKHFCSELSHLNIKQLEFERFYNFSWIPRECYSRITKLTLVEVNTLAGFPFDLLENLAELALIDCYLFEIPEELLKSKRMKVLTITVRHGQPHIPSCISSSGIQCNIIYE